MPPIKHKTKFYIMYGLIKNLISLQEVDSQIYKLKYEKGKKPEVLESISQKHRDSQENLNQLQNQLRELQVKMKNKEIELENKEETVRKYQMQLYQIKTNKEYASLQKEIAGIKADNSLLEDEIISLLERIEETEKTISNKKQELENIKEELVKNEKIVKEETIIIDDELFKLRRRRDEIVSGIDSEIIQKYEQILENRNGEALVRIENDTCGGCHMNQPPQVINEVRLGKLISCENCSRMLYIE